MRSVKMSPGRCTWLLQQRPTSTRLHCAASVSARAQHSHGRWKGTQLPTASRKALMTTSISASRKPLMTTSTSMFSGGSMDGSSPISSQLGSTGTLGFGFSAGGLLYAYYVGVIVALRDELGLLNANTPVAGASAGALIAATSKSGLSEADLVEATLMLARDCRQNGTRFRLRSVLNRTLRDVLPDDIHERCSGNTHLAVTQLWPQFAPRLVSDFRSREHLIETLLTSCHIPWYFDGSLITGYGSTLAFDGGITNFIPVPPDCTVAVRVACFPRENLRLFSGIGISPDSFESWPHDMRQMIQWALEPASEDMLKYLVNKGKRDARAWAGANGFPLKPDAAPAVQSVVLRS